MNRFTRMLTMAGLGLVTSVTMSAGPAMASSSTEQGTAQTESSARSWWGNDRVVGFFRSYGICDRAGEYGEDEGWWEDYDCVRVPSGFHSRRFALVVERNHWGHGWTGHLPGRWVGQWWPGHVGGGPGNWFPGRPHRPWFPGRPPIGFPGRPPIGFPPIGQPPIGQPPVGQPPVGQPPVGLPPVGQPPVGPPVGFPPIGLPPRV